MCGCCSAAVVLISITKRSAPSTAASSGLSTLTATFALVPQIVGEIDGRHAALPEFALESVVWGEGGGQARIAFAHT